LKVFETERFFGPIAEKGDEFARPIDFLVFDTGEADGTDSLLYSSNLAISTPGRIPESYLQLETWEPVFQRKWRIVFYQPPAAGPQSLADYVPQIILAAGAALGFFLFLSVASLTSSTLSGVQLARQMTQRLRLSEEQYRNIFASLRDLLFHTNLAGKILLINPSAENYLHRPPAELIGTQAELLFANPALFRDLLERIRKGEQIANVTTTLNQNGQSITVSVNAYVLRSDSGAAQEIEWVLRDISSRS
jgi:PAS domain S-box-containing protein